MIPFTSVNLYRKARRCVPEDRSEVHKTSGSESQDRMFPIRVRYTSVSVMEPREVLKKCFVTIGLLCFVGCVDPPNTSADFYCQQHCLVMLETKRHFSNGR
jgi:hypothetical protein